MATRLAPRRFVGVALIRLSWLTVFLFALIGLASISNKVKTQLAPSDIRDSISQLNEPLESKSLERNFMDTRDDGSSERQGKRTEATKKNVANVFPEVDSSAKGFESQLTTISTRTISKLADSSQAIPMGQTDLGRHSNQSTTSSVSLQTSNNRSNDSSNVSTSNTSAYNEAELRFVRGIMITNSLICAIGMCGNAIVVLVILKFTRVETVTDIYILNLAFADLMFVAGLIFLITTMYKGDWVFGSTMCKIFMSTTSLNQFASSLLLVVMSFDRFLAVCHPIYAQRFRLPRRAKIICMCIWIVCLILMTPILIFAKTGDQMTCAIFWPEYEGFNCEIAFTMYSFAIGFALPLMLIAAFYSCVVHRLRKAANVPMNSQSSRRSRSRETTNRRVENLVIGIICTYTICWLPYWITQISVSITPNQSPEFYSLVLIGTSLSYTNSALNPILYAFLSDNFKRRCTDVFRSIGGLKWCSMFLIPLGNSQDNPSGRVPASQSYSGIRKPSGILQKRQTGEGTQLQSRPAIHFQESTKLNSRTMITNVTCFSTSPKRDVTQTSQEDSERDGEISREDAEKWDPKGEFGIKNIVAPEILAGIVGPKGCSFKQLHSCFNNHPAEFQGV